MLTRLLGRLQPQAVLVARQTLWSRALGMAVGSRCRKLCCGLAADWPVGVPGAGSGPELCAPEDGFPGRRRSLQSERIEEGWTTGGGAPLPDLFRYSLFDEVVQCLGESVNSVAHRSRIGSSVR
jgi:hypothetical protein